MTVEHVVEILPICISSGAFFGITLHAGSTLYLVRREADAVDGLVCACCDSAVLVGEFLGMDTEIPLRFISELKSLFWILAMT